MEFSFFFLYYLGFYILNGNVYNITKIQEIFEKIIRIRSTTKFGPSTPTQNLKDQNKNKNRGKNKKKATNQNPFLPFFSFTFLYC